MDELTIRRDIRFPSIQLAGAGKSEKPEKQVEAGQSKGTVSSGAGVTVSDTLRQLLGRGGQAEALLRESQQTLQIGEAVLAEVQDKLERMAQLAQQAAQGGEDTEALQAELEQLKGEIERIIRSAVVGDMPLFLDGELDLEVENVSQLLERLLELAQEGVPPDEAIARLTDGAYTSLEDFLNQFTGGTREGLEEFLATPLMMALLSNLQGEQADLLMALLQNAQSAQDPQSAPEPPPEAPGAEGNGSMQAGSAQAEGKDLSGVSYDASREQVTVRGGGDVTLRGDAKTIVLSGSGTVTLQNVKASRLVADGGTVQIFTAGESVLEKIELQKGTTLVLDGRGLLKAGGFQGDGSNLLRLLGGAVEVLGEDGGGEPGVLELPVQIEGAASLAAQAGSVRGADGEPLKPFDLLWKALLPGWSGVTALTVDGQQTKLSLWNSNPPDPIRLWLAKEDNSHGFSLHHLLVQGRDKSGRTRTRYSFLQWNQRTSSFQEVSRYPNPFTVTGGEPGEDWVYEEETHTLSILTDRVTAIAGGSGVDADQAPFSGRVALADRIGTVALALDGVVCRVSEGKAFDLGQENNVTLVLQSDAENVFESGPGIPGISLGARTLLSIDCLDPDGVLTATIGAQAQGAGICLQMGEESVTLPQFRLSSRALQLDRLCITTQEAAREAVRTLEADQNWVAQLQAAYSALHSQLEQGSVRGTAPAAMLPRKVLRLLR